MNDDAAGTDEKQPMLPEIARQLREERRKVMCPSCRKEGIVTETGACPRCKLPLVGDDEIPF